MTTLIPQFEQTGSSVNRPINLKLQEIVSVKDFGATGNGTTDDTTAIQNAINSGAQQIYVPATTNGYRTTSPIIIATGVTIIGDGTDPYGASGPFGTRGSGSWFFLDHNGIGFNIINGGGSNFVSTVRYEKIGTYRNHTNSLSPGWTPNNFDFDFVAYNADVFYTDLMLLNPNKGINHNNGNAGRVTIDNVRGQFMTIGININKALDTVRINNFHNWPFWQNNSNVTAYTQQNCTAIALNRCDNPLLSNIFSIFTNVTLGLYQNSDGKTSKIHAVNMDCDITNYVIYVDSSVNTATGQFSNITTYGPPPSTGNYGIRLLGTNCRFDFSNLEGQNLSRGLVSIENTGNIVTMSNVRVDGWDTLGSGNALMKVTTGSQINIANPMVLTSTSGTVQFNATGVLKYQYSTLGSGVIPSSGTTVVVNHGLPTTPSLNQIQVWMETGIAAAHAVWASNITSTQFTINCDTAPGANITVGWRATLEY
jgi:hypothetical protein